MVGVTGGGANIDKFGSRKNSKREKCFKTRRIPLVGYMSKTVATATCAAGPC